MVRHSFLGYENRPWGIRTGRTDYTRWPHTAFTVAVLAGAILAAARPAAPLDRLCDPSFENCRPQLLDLINKETQGIDVAFWFMEDPR
jgi:hypothetical protein